MLAKVFGRAGAARDRAPRWEPASIRPDRVDSAERALAAPATRNRAAP